jgi:hypothetical protein
MPLLRMAGAIAALLNRQNHRGRSAWWPGGRAATNIRRPFSNISSTAAMAAPTAVNAASLRAHRGIGVDAHDAGLGDRFSSRSIACRVSGKHGSNFTCGDCLRSSAANPSESSARDRAQPVRTFRMTGGVMQR